MYLYKKIVLHIYDVLLYFEFYLYSKAYKSDIMLILIKIRIK